MIGFVKESVDQTNTRRGRDRPVARRARMSGCRSATSRSRRPTATAATSRRSRISITGERHPIEWGGIRLRIDPARDPAVLLPLPGVRGADMNVLSSIDTNEL